MNQPLAIPEHVARLRGQRMLAQEGQEGLSGNPVPYLSIKGSRFTAIDATGNQMPLGAMDTRGLFLDVMIVDLNHAVSKTYYEGAFDPSAQDYKPPTCFSDNGTGPSARVASPPSMSCASCPMNVWGSKISENGSETKLCNDSKKVALLLADMRVAMPFRLNIPPASLKSWKTHCQTIAGNGADLTMIVTRLRFDPQSSSPILQFEAIDWVSAAQADLIEQTLADDTKLQSLTGRDDVAKQFGVAAIAPPAAPAPALAYQPQFVPPPVAPAPPPQAHYTQPAAPQPQAHFAPPPLQPAAPPPSVPQGFGAPPAPGQAAEAPKRKRAARTPAAAAPAAPAAPAPGFAPAAPPGFGAPPPAQGFAPPPAAPTAFAPPPAAPPGFAPPPAAPAAPEPGPMPGFLRRPQPAAAAPAGAAPPAFGMVPHAQVSDASLDQSIEAALSLRT